MKFDSKPTKTKKQLKKELEAFPTLDGDDEIITRKSKQEEKKSEQLIA